MFVNLPVFCSLQSLFLQKKKNEFKKKEEKKDEDMANSSPVLHFFSFQQHHQSSSHSCNQTTLLIVCPKINLVTLTSEPLLYSKSTISVHQQTRHLFFFSFSLFGGLQSSVSRAKQFPNIIQRGCFRLQNAARCKNGKEGRP